jgi:SAM-dependent methyltransferase
MSVDIKTRIPWQAKIAAKILLARLPVGYGVWRRLRLFRRGRMERPDYAYRVFRRHFDRVDFPRKGHGFVALELGPGHSLFSSMIASALGASSMQLVDAGPFATEEIEPYRAMARLLQREGLPAPNLDGATSVKDVVGRCRARYGTAGVASLRSIPDQSVDFILSQAVLEHIRRDEFVDLLRELRRVLRPDGVCSHRVDLKDHFNDALNNLRFSERVWESPFMASSGFYTNRIRYAEMLDLFRQAGFDAEVVNVDRWARLPTPRNRLAEPFRHLPDEDLRVSGFDVLLRPAQERRTMTDARHAMITAAGHARNGA